MKESSIVSGLGLLLIASASMCGPSASAQIPTYSNFQLQARSNLCVNQSPDIYNLPCNVFFNSATPVINDQKQVAIKLNVLGPGQGVWFGENGTGNIAYQSPADASLSDASINNSGYVVFPQTFTAQNGIYFYNHATNTSGFLTNQPLGSTSWGGVEVNDAGQIGYRANFNGPQAFYSFEAPSSLIMHAADASALPGSPYSFLFTPTFNNNRQIAAHVRLGAAGHLGAR